MPYYSNTTTIRVHEETKQQLFEQKRREADTYDDVVRRLINGELEIDE